MSWTHKPHCYQLWYTTDNIRSWDAIIVGTTGPNFDYLYLFSLHFTAAYEQWNDIIKLNKIMYSLNKQISEFRVFHCYPIAKFCSFTCHSIIYIHQLIVFLIVVIDINISKGICNNLVSYVGWLLQAEIHKFINASVILNKTEFGLIKTLSLRIPSNLNVRLYKLWILWHNLTCFSLFYTNASLPFFRKVNMHELALGYC